MKWPLVTSWAKPPTMLALRLGRAFDPYNIPREETSLVLTQLNAGAAVLLTGDAGSGKSGIGIELLSSRSSRASFPYCAMRQSCFATRPRQDEAFL